MVEHRSYLIGARSKLASFHSAGGCNDDNDIVSALRVIEQMISFGTVSGPLPRNLQTLTGPTQENHATGSEGGEVARPRRRQAALTRFGSFSLGEANLNKVLSEAARVCAEGLGVPLCKVGRYRSDDLLVEAEVGWDEGVIERVVARADESSPQGRASITGQPVVCDELALDASSVLPAFYAERGIISTVDVVIRVASEPYGMLEVDCPVQHNNDEHDVNLLTRFANILADVTSLGLVISELIANSYAHAFPGGKGSIRVQLSPGHSGDETTLVLADDGLGFPELRPDKRHGVGLVMRLREHIGGSAAVRSDHGTEWALKFPISDDTRAGSAR